MEKKHSFSIESTNAPHHQLFRSLMLFELSRPPLTSRTKGCRVARIFNRATTSVSRASSKTPETTPFAPSTSSLVDADLISLPPLALKEWSPVVASLLSGHSTLLLRKGGIKEPKFVPRARSFALVPTSFHVDGELLSFDSSSRSSPRPLSSAFSPGFDQRGPAGVDIEGVAVVTGAWALSAGGSEAEGEEEELLLSAAADALSDFHPFRRRCASGSSSPSSSPPLRRLGFRPGAPVTLLELRVFNLNPVVRVSQAAAEENSYWGCRSWVQLGDEESARLRESARATTTALDDEDFSLRARSLREALSSRLPEGCVVEPLEI